MSKEIEEKQLDSDALEKAVQEVLDEISKSEVAEVADKAEEEASEEVVEKAEHKEVVKKKAKKAEDEDDEEEDEAEEEDEVEMKSKKKKVEVPEMKLKSLSEDEYQEYMDLKKAKLAEAEVLEKSERISEIKKAVAEQTSEKFDSIGEVLKSFVEEMNLLKGKIDELGAQPARERKSAKDVATIEKSFANEESSEKKLSKSQIVGILEDLYKSNKVKLEDVALFESSGILSPMAKSAIKEIK